jgi:hypothetical protein
LLWTFCFLGGGFLRHRYNITTLSYIVNPQTTSTSPTSEIAILQARYF